MKSDSITNKEYILACLNDEIDDGGASYEACVHYHIACPYGESDERAPCHGKGLDYPNRKNCVACKLDWLESEADV